MDKPEPPIWIKQELRVAKRRAKKRRALRRKQRARRILARKRAGDDGRFLCGS